MAHVSNSEPPVRFLEHPEVGRVWPNDAVIDSLDMTSLAQTTSRLREVMTGEKSERARIAAIKRVFDFGVNVTTFEFLESLVASWSHRNQES